VLNHIAMSNHIRLLVRDRGLGEVAASMRLVAGRTSQEFNQRKSRHGAFRADRNHATAVPEDDHFACCMTHIDLNMLRARVVHHPAEWEVSGYSEIQRP
jgi:putative transposase